MSDSINHAQTVVARMEENMTGSEVPAASKAEGSKSTKPESIIEQILERLGEDQDGELPQLTSEQWEVIRKTAGLQIDPETAELLLLYDEELDLIAEEDGTVGNIGEANFKFYARNPGSDELILLEDLPEAVRDRLIECRNR